MRLLGTDATRAVCGYGQVDLERAVFSDDARVVRGARRPRRAFSVD